MTHKPQLLQPFCCLTDLRFVCLYLGIPQVFQIFDYVFVFDDGFAKIEMSSVHTVDAVVTGHRVCTTRRRAPTVQFLYFSIQDALLPKQKWRCAWRIYHVMSTYQQATQIFVQDCCSNRIRTIHFQNMSSSSLQRNISFKRSLSFSSSCRFCENIS